MWETFTMLLGIALIVQYIWGRRKRLELVGAVEQRQAALEDAQNQLAEKLEAAARRQETLFDRMIEGVLILDDQRRVRLVNASLRELLGLTGEVLGKRLIEAVRSHELQEIATQARDHGHVTGRNLVISSGAESRYYAVNASSFKESETETGVIVVLHDLTSLKQVESGRREFVANVSHELRTPLSMIKGYVETLLGGNVDDPRTEARFLGKIQKHSNRLTYLIEDLLALSQLESNQIAVSFARVPLFALVDRVFEDLQDRAAGRGVRLEAFVDRDLQVWVDPDRIQQVFQNLVDNGIKYGRQGGNLIVRAEPGEDGFVTVSVADDGPGIPEELVDRVFERFFRVDKARSREQGGTGLGLAIVKHVIQSHGGRVWVSRGEESGAVFSFTVPTGPGPEGRGIAKAG